MMHFSADQFSTSQDVFQAETAEFRMRVTYDDVEPVTSILVQFKGRYTPDGSIREARVDFADSREAVARALRFVAKHPAPRPVCLVDY